MDILKVENLKKVYIKDKNEFTAVNNVDLNIKEGECVGLVGESGCGKSSIARMITNLERHSGGDIFINGINIKNLWYLIMNQISMKIVVLENILIMIYIMDLIMI